MVLVDPEIACGIMEAIGSQEARTNFCDFTVIVEGKRFACHRFILNACSGFFSALFRSGMKETLDHTVTVYGIPSGIFALILDCLYKGMDILTEDNVIELWHAANLLQIAFLVTQCEKFIIDKLLVENYSEVYRHAKLLDSTSVLKAALELMVKNFGSYSFSSSFVHLYPPDLQALLESEDLDASSEDVVVNAVLTWVSYAPDKCNEDQEVAASEFWYEKKSSQIEAKVPNHENSQAEDAGQEDKEAQENLSTSEFDASSKCLVTSKLAGDGDTEKVDTEPTSTLCSSQAAAIKSRSESETGKQFSDACVKDSLHGGTSDSREDDKGHEIKLPVATVTKPRKEYLGQLLAACRMCLISPDCIEKLMSNELVLESKEALAAVRQAIMYNLKPSPYWPFSAIHRVKSTMENVAVFFDDKYLKVYSLRNDRLYFLGELPDMGEGSGSIKIANNQIFMVRNGGGYYSSAFAIFAFIEPKSWFRVIDNADTPYYVIPHGDHMYMVKGSLLYRFNTKHLWANKTPMENICSLPINFYNYSTPAAATFGNKILLFCSTSSSITVTVICIDTQTFKVTTSSSLDGPAEKMVSFGDGKNTYILQMNGTLMKVVDDPQDGVDFQFMTKLWGFDWNLQGAILYNNQLFLFGTGTEEQRSWSTSLPGYFDHIKVVQVKSRCQCVAVTVPKRWMLQKL